MKIMYFNADGRQVRIKIAGDHHLEGNRLCCGCSVAKTDLGWVKLMWTQGAQVKMQKNLILSVVQMRDNGCVVSDVAIAHGGKQQIITPGGVQLPLIIKNGFSYLVHQYPNDKQMKEIVRVEFMTSRNAWDPTRYYSPEGDEERLIKQFFPLPADITDKFYNDQGDIRVTKSLKDPDRSDSMKQRDSKPDPVVVETVVDDLALDSKLDPVVIESETGPVVVEPEVGPADVGNNEQYNAKPNDRASQSKPKPKKQKRNQRPWNNNKKKIRCRLPMVPYHLVHQ